MVLYRCFPVFSEGCFRFSGKEEVIIKQKRSGAAYAAPLRLKLNILFCAARIIGDSSDIAGAVFSIILFS